MTKGRCVWDMGYGSLEAISKLRDAGISITDSPGFRSGILIVDGRGWVFTPIAWYLEEEPQSDETPNAIELSPAQVEEFALRFCPATRDEAIHSQEDPELALEIAHLPHEFGIKLQWDVYSGSVPLRGGSFLGN